MQKTKRIQFIDTAKFLGLLFVVFMHGYQEGRFLGFIHSFIIPLFFFLNGMTMKLDNISFGDYLAKKVKGFVIPTVTLGIIAVLFDAGVRMALGQQLDDAFLWRGFYFSVNQNRFTALWFLSAVFFCDIFLFWLYQKFKGNVWLMGLGSLAILGFGIAYNIYYKATLAWNVDASFIGIIFTYFGFLVTSKNLAFLYQPIVNRRWLSLLVGAVLMVGTYFLSMHIWLDYNTHLNMFGSVYGKFYLTLPCALLGSLGFTFACRGITNPVLAYMVKFNLIFLMLHQGFVFPLFKGIVVYPWWCRVAFMSVDRLEYNMFVLLMTLFSLLLSVVLHGVIVATPLSFVVNRPRYPLIKKIGDLRKK